MPGKLGKIEPGDEVVISGIAGRFPESDNLMHLQENLFNKVDLITDDHRRWKSDNPDIPQRIGKINNLDKFDSQFFGIHFKEAHTIDPMGRMLMEHAYEAIIDAGVNPRRLRGTNTGVFIGTCYSESEKTWLYNPRLKVFDIVASDVQSVTDKLFPPRLLGLKNNEFDINQSNMCSKLAVNSARATSQEIVLYIEHEEESGTGMTGCCRSMMANRISHWLGCTGPSCAIDTACSSSLFAMNQAYRAIRRGECDAALVGGCNLCLHPHLSLQFFLLGVLSRDGHCRSFDADGKGYCRSEAISVIYLQKCKDAKRIYAHVVYTKTNCDGFKEEGITFPSSTMQRVLLEGFYEECGVPPSSLAYVEAHGTGTKVGDPVEADALDKVFCPGRTTPLRIGTVKSNLGHSEPASGLCSIAKVIIAMESGYIPPNLHYNRPRKEIASLEDGRIQIISELTPWDGGYVGINSFGFGGGNAHVLLNSHLKEKKNAGRPTDNMPRLVVVSGRTEEAVTTLLDKLESSPVDVEYISLFHDIHSEEIPGHLYRGYTILPPLGLREKSVREVQHYPGLHRPVCFVFSGMGCQWTGIGQALLQIPTFAKAVQKCDDALKPYGIDIAKMFSNKDPKIFDNISNSLVTTAVVQIGLVDVLTSMRIVPDITIGHSVGELGCAYANGCLTAEQTVLAAYFQGLALGEAKLIRGTMAKVGLSHVQLSSICPADIDIACHDSPDSTTISGPVDSIKAFVSKLQIQGISAKEEVCNNIAYHSRYVKSVGPKILAHLQKVIPEPKPRSEKWLSTSVSRKAGKISSARLCSPEYFTNNLLNPVLFEETTNFLPNNAITIEIAPQTMLHRSSNKKGINIALTKRGHENNVGILLKAIGRLYVAGLHPQVVNLYPKIPYPVSRGTPMISPFLRWDHSDDWCVVRIKTQEKIDSGERIVNITLTDEAFEWMGGHVIDGRNLVPATGYLALIWETVGMMRGEAYTEVSVVFEDVTFHRATTIPKEERGVDLTLMIQRGSGRFEVVEGGVTVVSGIVRTVSNPSQECGSNKVLLKDDEELELTDRDVYKELRLRGYQYGGLFRGIKGASLNGSTGRIAWEKNWVAFMDNMLQMKMLGIDTRGLFVPTGIQKLVIDTTMHRDQLHAMPDDDKVFTVKVDKDLGIIVSGGVEIRGLKASAIARKKPAGDPVLEDFKFIAHRDRAEMKLEVITQMAAHIALENMNGVKIKTFEFIGETDVSPENLSSPLIKEILGNIPLLQADINIIAPINTFSNDVLPSDITISEPKNLAGESGAFFTVSHSIFVSKSIETLKLLKSTMSDGAFLLAREPLNIDTDIVSALKSEGFDVVLEKRTSNESLILVRKKQKPVDVATTIQVNNHEFMWLEPLRNAMTAEAERKSRTRRKIVLVSEGDFESGLLGLVNCLRKEPGGEVIQGLLIQDLQAPKFSLDNPLYAEQLKLGLVLNVLRPGKLWGTYRFFPIDAVVPKSVYHAQINQHTRGDLSAIEWVEGTIQRSNQQRNIIQIHYSSINFKDVMLATGKLAIEVAAKRRQMQENVIGFEFAGRDADGRAVMGMLESGALSNLCICDRDILWAVPDDWTLEDAATVPAVYGTAYYALFLSGKMKRGDKVLIHAGSGGVGQAAITLALYEGCEVFTTVGTLQKREFIKKQFPEIDDDHIGNSRDTSFEQLVLRKTQGRGVDIVLNSLAEEKLQASVRCLARHGRFLEIGKFDLAANNPIGMEAFLKGISFHGVLLDNLFTASSDRKTKLVALIDEGIKSGAIKPLVRTVFPMDQTEAAFRYMAAGKHIGKVIVKVRDGDDNVRQSQLPLALPRYHCSEESSYLILGGLGGFGLELADWLVLRGARKLVLTSRKGISNGYQRMRINIWKSYGVAVVIVAEKDASTPEGCEAILKEAIALGPVSAIFNLAVVLEDAFFEDQTVQKFEESLRVKAWATKQFDLMSRTMCPQLKHFVVFSSVSCGRGNAGQTNYGMANSIMERICETRVAQSLPGLAVQWGAIGDVGLVADMQADNKEVIIGGTLQQRISSCLQELDNFLQQNSTVVSSMVVAEKRAGGAGATNIVNTVLNIMGLKDLKTLSVHTSLAELGMDSMMAVEIKQTLEREFEVFLTASEIRSLNFAKLQELCEKEATDDRNLEQKADSEIEDVAGLRLPIRTLGTEPLNKNICVPLVTGAKNDREEVFIVPGIEGTHTVLKSLASKLKSPTTCLQLGTNHLNSTSIADIADYLLPHVRARSKGRKDFTIAGYSFGSVVAIELVRRLESEGFSGRLILIDGSPDYLRALMSSFLMVAEDKMQSNFLLAAADISASSYIRTELEAGLQNCTTWDEKLAVFTKNVPEITRLNFTQEDQIATLSSIYYRIVALRSYDTSASSPLKTPITLIKPTIQSVRSMSEDYGLRLVTQERVETYYAKGDHLTILDDDICAAVIDGGLIENIAIHDRRRP